MEKAKATTVTDTTAFRTLFEEAQKLEKQADKNKKASEDGCGKATGDVLLEQANYEMRMNKFKAAQRIISPTVINTLRI